MSVAARDDGAYFQTYITYSRLLSGRCQAIRGLVPSFTGSNTAAPRSHIFSGASMPSRPKLRASTRAVKSQSTSRESRSASVAALSTGHPS